MADLTIRDSASFGKLVRSWRRLRRWSQADLAREVGLSRTWLIAVEKGTKAVSLEVAIKILAGFGVSLHATNPPQLSNGRGPAQLAAFHAEPKPGQADAGRPSEQDWSFDYKVADLADCSARRDELFSPGYVVTIAELAEEVVGVEGPLFLDVLVRRIAAAHRLSRATRKLFTIIDDAILKRFRRSEDDGRQVLWPHGTEPASGFVAFRKAGLGTRNYTDIPLQELASLAEKALAGTVSHELALLYMARELGLGAMRAAARKRFEAAIDSARKS